MGGSGDGGTNTSFSEFSSKGREQRLRAAARWDHGSGIHYWGCVRDPGESGHVVRERGGKRRREALGVGAREGADGHRRWPQTGPGPRGPGDRSRKAGGLFGSELESERARSWDPSLLAPNPSHSRFPCCHGAGKVSGVQFALAGVTHVLSNHPDASRGASSPTSLHASFGNFRVACILGLFPRPHWTVPLGGRH